jgi:redox-sensitive bicupin YhaK (pirin superfamily)
VYHLLSVIHVSLWVCAAKEKMTQPRYQDIPKSDIPSVPLGGDCGHARVVAGTLLGTEGPIKMRNPGLLLDVSIHAGSTWSCEQIFPQEWNGFCYIYEGAGILGDQNVKMRHAYIFDRGTGDILVAKAGSEELKFLLIAGKPINEPIVQYGPFVMNHELEIAQAFDDYRSGKLQNPEDDPFSPWEG